WNKDLPVPILPFLHATDYFSAMNICQTGFCALSQLDSGWYGKGIYFTSYAIYATQYLTGKKQPVMILSWIIPGSIYPVVEDPFGKDSMGGKALESGF